MASTGSEMNQLTLARLFTRACNNNVLDILLHFYLFDYYYYFRHEHVVVTGCYFVSVIYHWMMT